MNSGMSEETFLELSRCTINISKRVESSLSWCNSVLTVLTDKGVELYEFKYDIKSLYKNVETIASLIPCSKYSPTQRFFPPDLASRVKSNEILMQLNLDPALWAHNQETMKECAATIKVAWSPPDFVYNNECSLAILTNLGCIELYAKCRIGWHSIFSLSREIERYYKSLYSENVDLLDITILKSTCLAVQTSSVCWSDTLCGRGCYFVTAQRNADILFWKLEQPEIGPMERQFVGKLNSDFGEIDTMTWVKRAGENNWLICSSMNGVVKLFEFTIRETTVTLIKTKLLWNYQDRLLIREVKTHEIGDKLVLLLAKNRHLMVFLIDNNCEIIQQYVNNVTDYTITFITRSLSNFYLGTRNSKIFEVCLKVDEEKMEVQLIPIVTKDDFSKYDTLGFCPSPNGAIWALNVIKKDLAFRKLQLQIDLIFLTSDKFNPVKTLMANQSQSLASMWDCIELIRYQSLKLKSVPDLDYNSMLEESNVDDYQGKIYLVFSAVHNSIKAISRYTPGASLSEQSHEKVRDIILSKHAINMVDKLFKLFQQNGRQLTEFQKETYIGCCKYLKHFCKKHERNVEQYVNMDAVSVVAGNIDTVHYTCQCCDENVDGFTCSQGHPNLFCIVTFTPIMDNDYLLCKVCGCLGRTELYSDKPTCTICDVYLDKHMFL